jgi:hypothetical protein
VAQSRKRQTLPSEKATMQESWSGSLCRLMWNRSSASGGVLPTAV